MISEFKPTWLMIKKHNSTGFMYFCKTTKTDPYQYKGSGKRWINHLAKHGRDVSTLWAKQFMDLSELTEFAIFFSEFYDIVNAKDLNGNKLWANLVNENGLDGFCPGTKHTSKSKSLMRIRRLGKHTSPEHLKSVSKPVEVNGQHFPSATEAARSLGLKKITLIKRVLNPNFKEYRYTVEA